MESEKDFKNGMDHGYYYKEANLSTEDRNWNWREKVYRYSPTREKINPKYVGTYALDALAMALHLSYYSNSAKEALIKAANMGGDSDTVADLLDK